MLPLQYKRGALYQDRLQQASLISGLSLPLPIWAQPTTPLLCSHSLRRSFATAASRQGAMFHAIMRQGRWRHQGTVLGYIEAGQRFEENAAKQG